MAPSFGELVGGKPTFREALTNHVARTLEKLRNQQMAAGAMTVFLHTNRFRQPVGQYANSRSFLLPIPTNLIPELTHYATLGLDSIYKPGYAYKKVGLRLSALQPDSHQTPDLFEGELDPRLTRLLPTVERINRQSCCQKLAKNEYICRYLETLALDKAINTALREQFGNQEAIPKAALLDCIKDYYGVTKLTTLTWRLHALTQEGVLTRVGFGLYRLNDRPLCWAEPTPALRLISNRLKIDIPLATCCVWDTRLLASLMIQQPMKHLQLVEVERDVAESVYNRLRFHGEPADYPPQSVYLYEDWLVLSRRGLPDDNPIIIKPLISEAPLRQQGEYVTAPLEKILVDLLADQEFYHAYREEAETMFRDALARFIVNRDKLRRYARRRNRLQQVQTLLTDAGSAAPAHSPS